MGGPGYTVAIGEASLQAAKETMAPVLARETREAADVARAIHELEEALARLKASVPY